jgi:exonuclease VII large subunit
LNSQDLLESATLSGLEQRLYHRFKDSIRNERLQDANPIEEIEKQNAKIGHVRNKLSQSSMMSQMTDANPETSQLSNKLTALEKTYLNPKAGKVITRKNNRKILGDLSQNDLVPAQLTEEISAAISALPSC